MSLLGELTGSVRTLASIVSELKSHLDFCESEGSVVEKDIVLPLFRNLAGVQAEWKTKATQYGNIVAESYVDSQFSPAVKALGAKLMAAMQDPTVVPEAKQQLRLY
jgi:hypothetical protein